MSAMASQITGEFRAQRASNAENVSDNILPDFINTLRFENLFAIHYDNYAPGSHMVR